MLYQSRMDMKYQHSKHPIEKEIQRLRLNKTDFIWSDKSKMYQSMQLFIRKTFGGKGWNHICVAHNSAFCIASTNRPAQVASLTSLQCFLCEVSILGMSAGLPASWRLTTATWQQQRGKGRWGAEPVFTLSLQQNWWCSYACHCWLYPGGKSCG